MRHDKRYLVACSSGPDSMALLDMLLKKGYQVAVAHINHGKREQSKQEEAYLRQYCVKHNIVFHLGKLTQEFNANANFQANAREYRYSFFSNLVKKYHYDYVVLAHHLDDLITTYLMQKKANIIPDYYGIKRLTIIKGIKIIRPLLKYQKKNLLNYCNLHNIKYFIDESNNQKIYKRNQIKIEIVDEMTKKEKTSMLSTINSLNKQLKKERAYCDDFLKAKDSISIDDFITFKYQDELVRKMFLKNLSLKEIQEIKRQLINCDKVIFEKQERYLTKEYGYIYFFKKPHNINYVVYNQNELNKHLRKLNINQILIKDEFPLIIRNTLKSDSIKLKFGTKKLNRYFIDNKVIIKKRLSTIVIENNKQEIIFVQGIGFDINHSHKNVIIFDIKGKIKKC